MNDLSYGMQARIACELSLGSMTRAMQAKRLLSRYDISVRIKKLGDTGSSRGCVYGIEYPCDLSGNIRAILQKGGIDTSPL